MYFVVVSVRTPLIDSKVPDPETQRPVLSGNYNSIGANGELPT